MNRNIEDTSTQMMNRFAAFCFAVNLSILLVYICFEVKSGRMNRLIPFALKVLRDKHQRQFDKRIYIFRFIKHVNIYRFTETR